MRIIDADKLINEIKQMDLGFMQHSDVVECLEDIINRQPTVSKIVEIKNVSTFDNRKICN